MVRNMDLKLTWAVNHSGSLVSTHSHKILTVTEVKTDWQVEQYVFCWHGLKYKDFGIGC